MYYLLFIINQRSGFNIHYSLHITRYIVRYAVIPLYVGYAVYAPLFRLREIFFEYYKNEKPPDRVVSFLAQRERFELSERY